MLIENTVRHITCNLLLLLLDKKEKFKLHLCMNNGTYGPDILPVRLTDRVSNHAKAGS